MKKYLKLLIVTITILLSTGCIKSKTEMSINIKKEMTLEHIYAFKDALVEQSYANSIAEAKRQGKEWNIVDELDDEKINEAIKKGYQVYQYKEDGYTGITLRKNIKNIDEISTSEETGAVDISFDYVDTGRVHFLFNVNKGFFKNKYVAKFDATKLNKGNDFTDSYVDNSIQSDYTKYADDNDEESTNDISSFMDGIESTFTLTLPMKPIKNNADRIANDGKTLTWDFVKNPNISTIEVEFEVINLGAVLSVGAALIAATLLFIINVLRNRKKEKEMDFVTKIESENNKNINVNTMDDAEVLDNVLNTNNSI